MPEPSLSTGPENIERTKEKLADALTRGLFPDGARNKELQTQVKRILDEEIVALEDQKKFELWLSQLSMIDDRSRLLKQIAPNDAQVAKILGDDAKDFFDTRDEIFQSILEHLGKESEVEQKKILRVDKDGKADKEESVVLNNAFITIGTKEAISTENEVAEIEKTVFSYSYYTNKVDRSGKMPLPDFQKIREWRGRIELAKKAIDPKDSKETSAEDRAATLARLERIGAGLSVLENMDPIGQANADPVGFATRNGGPAMLDAFKRLGIVNSDGTPRYDMRKTVNGRPSRDPLVMGLRGVGLLACTFMSLATLIIILRKKGKGLGPSDALILPYGAGALALSGMMNFKGKEKELDAVQKIQSFVFEPSFQNVIKKMGGGTNAAKAAEEFSLLVRDDKDKLEEIKKFLKPMIVLPRLEDLETFGVKKESMLYKTLSKSGVTPQDRRMFLSKLLENTIEDDDRMLAIITMMEGPAVR